MPEPSVSEILNINADPERGTGETAVVYNNSQVLSQLNQNALANQQNQWNRYNRFLNDYQDRLKTRQDIADMQVADSDREFLKKEATELFKTALDNPNVIYSPEFNNKLGEIKSNATSSKLARDYAEENLKQMALNPEWSTDENKEIVLDYIDNQTVEKGGRKTFALNLPDTFDMGKFWGGLMEDDPRVKSLENVNRVDEKQRLRYDRTDTRYSLGGFLKAAESTYDMPEIKKRADKMYNGLRDDIKSQFSSAKDFWVKLGAKYFGSDKDIVRMGKENVDAYDAPGEKAKEWIAKDKNNIQWRRLHNQEKAQTVIEGVGKQKVADLLTATETTFGANDPLVKEGSSGIIDVSKLPQSRQYISGIVYDSNGKPKLGMVKPFEQTMPDGTVRKVYNTAYFNSGGKKIIGIADLGKEYEANYKEFRKYGSWNEYLKTLAFNGFITPQFEGQDGVGTVNSIMEGERFEAAKHGKKGFENIYEQEEITQE